MTPLRPLCLLLVLFFSLPAWAGQGDAPLSPPELIPATDHDPKHLTMFVNHFFRWWVDNGIRYYETNSHTKEGKAVSKEREETLKKTLTPVLWETYKNSEGDVDIDDPILPWSDFQDNWRNTAFSQIVTLQDHTATLIVSFPRYQVSDSPADTPSQLRVLLQVQGGTWRIGEVRDVTYRD
jgi:hypothetical protein